MRRLRLGRFRRRHLLSKVLTFMIKLIWHLLRGQQVQPHQKALDDIVSIQKFECTPQVQLKPVLMVALNTQWLHTPKQAKKPNMFVFHAQRPYLILRTASCVTAVKTILTLNVKQMFQKTCMRPWTNVQITRCSTCVILVNTQTCFLPHHNQSRQ